MRPADTAAASFRRRREGIVYSTADRYRSREASQGHSTAPAISRRQILPPAHTATRTSQIPAPPYSAVTGNSVPTRPAPGERCLALKVGAEPQFPPAVQLIGLHFMLPGQRMRGRDINRHPGLHRQPGDADIGRVNVTRLRQANLRPLLLQQIDDVLFLANQALKFRMGKRWSNWFIRSSSTSGLSVSERTNVRRASVCAVNDTASSSSRVLAARIAWT